MTSYEVNRLCPITDQPASRVIAHIPARAIAASNNTYREEYAEILGISPDDRFPIVEGPSGFVYAGWLPPAEFLKKVYESVIDHNRTVTRTIQYRKWLLEFGAAFYGEILKFQNKDYPLRLLDFGCGYGEFLRILASSEIESVGFDPSRSRGETAVHDDVKIISTQDQLEKEGQFDVIVCTEVLEHVPVPKNSIKLLKTLLTSGGLLGVTVPQCERVDIDQTFRQFYNGRQLPRVFNPWEHLNYFSSASLQNLLAEEGFRVIRDFGISNSLQESSLRALTRTNGYQSIRGIAGVLKRLLIQRPSTQLIFQLMC